MRPVLVLISTLLLSLAASVPAAPAQEPAPDTLAAVEPAVSPAAQTGAAEVGYVVQSGLPQRAAPPRTLRAYWHVFVAFAITWLLLFGYALSLGRRFGRLDEEVQRLSRAPE